MLAAPLRVQVTGGTEINIYPAVLLQAYRWISDSRDEEKKKD